MDIYEIRLENLNRLIAEEGKIVYLAEKIGKPHSLICRWRSGKRLGSDVAREIEKITNKPAGWFDTQHDNNGLQHRDLDLYERIVISAGYDPEVLTKVSTYVNKHYPDLCTALPKEQYLRLIMAIAKGRKTEDPLPSDWITDLVALAQSQG